MTFSFGKKITQKGHFCSKMDTNLQIRTSLGTKFHLKLAILFSWIKFTKKHFLCKSEKANIANEF